MKNNHSTETEIPIWKKFEGLYGRSYLRDGVLRAIREKKFETALGLVCMYEDHMYLHRGIARGKNPHINEIASALEERIKTSLICSKILGETNNPFAYHVFNDVYDRAVDNLLSLCKTLESSVNYDLERARKYLEEERKYVSFDFYSKTDEAIKLAEKGLRWSNALNRIKKSSRKNAKKINEKGVSSFSHYALPNRIFVGEKERERGIELYKDIFSQKLEEAKRLKENGHQMDLDWRREKDEKWERESGKRNLEINEVKPREDKSKKESLISRLKKKILN